MTEHDIDMILISIGRLSAVLERHYIGSDGYGIGRRSLKSLHEIDAMLRYAVNIPARSKLDYENR